MPDDTLKAALIGTGNFARRQHLPNLARIRECELYALADLNTELASALGEKYGVRYTTGDYREILDDEAISLVIITVRDSLQAKVACEALEAGKHVYVEKPMGSTPAECSRVVAAQQSSGCRVAVGFNRRYAPVYRLAREVISGEGGAFNIHLRMADDAWRWAKGYPPGHLLQLDVCHLFDLLRWLTGSEIVSVYCASSRPDDDMLALRLANGATASVLFSGHGTMDMPKERLEVITERGGLTVDDFVELRTYGSIRFNPRYTFEGHADPDGEFLHRPLLKKIGAEGWSAIRRTIWEQHQREAPGGPVDRETRERFLQTMIPNFMRDQGWYASMRAFILSLRDGLESEHASAPDAETASVLSAAARESRRTGRVIDLDT